MTTAYRERARQHTSKPAKELINLALLRDCKLSQGRKVGVDFGCKAMRNYPLFFTDEYYGVDFDAEALALGKEIFPEARTVCGEIETADVPLADFALCVNVFGGANNDDSEPVRLLNAIINRIARGGILLVTFRKKIDEDIDALRDICRASFETVDDLPIAVETFPRSRFARLEGMYRLYVAPKPKEYTRFYCRCIGRL